MIPTHKFKCAGSFFLLSFCVLGPFQCSLHWLLEAPLIRANQDIIVALCKAKSLFLLQLAGKTPNWCSAFPSVFLMSIELPPPTSRNRWLIYFGLMPYSIPGFPSHRSETIFQTQLSPASVRRFQRSN